LREIAGKLTLTAMSRSRVSRSPLRSSCLKRGRGITLNGIAHPAFGSRISLQLPACLQRNFNIARSLVSRSCAPVTSILVSCFAARFIASKIHDPCLGSIGNSYTRCSLVDFLFFVVCNCFKWHCGIPASGGSENPPDYTIWSPVLVACDKGRYHTLNKLPHRYGTQRGLHGGSAHRGR
jgi:hypothetical protein